MSREKNKKINNTSNAHNKNSTYDP